MPFSFNRKTKSRPYFGHPPPAAIGLTEQTDAIVVVASEETGDISLCYNGKLLRDLDLNQLSEKLKSNFKHRKNK